MWRLSFGRATTAFATGNGLVNDSKILTPSTTQDAMDMFFTPSDKKLSAPDACKD